MIPVGSCGCGAISCFGDIPLILKGHNKNNTNETPSFKSTSSKTIFIFLYYVHTPPPAERDSCCCCSSQIFIIQMTLEVLFEDESMVVINKPHGLLVHRSKLAADVEECALQLLYVFHAF
jgi:23S rRNA-/tRNA-specific pseudouridylate synthase